MTADGLARLTLVLLATGIFAWLGVVALTALALLRPPRMTDGKAVYRLRRLSPADLGIAFEEESYRANGVVVAAWWMPITGSTTTVILIHGYADAKVGAIAWAPVLHAAGCNVLAVDLRRHGASGGVFCTGGVRESIDVSAVIDRLKIDRPIQTRRVALFGVSLGSAVAAAVAAGRSDVAGVILESPMADFGHAIRRHARIAGLPGGLLLTTAIALAQKVARVRFSDVRPLSTLPRLRCPVLAVVGADDALLDEADRAAIRIAVGPGQFWLVPGAPHLLAMHVDPAGYYARIKAFLGQ